MTFSARYFFEVAAIGQQTPDVFNTLFAKVENRFALADDRSLRAILQFGLLVDVQLGGMSAIEMHGKLSKQGDRTPWLNTQSYRQDIKLISKAPVDDDVMQFHKAKVRADR